MKGLALALRATKTPEFRRTFTPHRHFTRTSKIINIYTYNLSSKNDRYFTVLNYVVSYFVPFLIHVPSYSTRYTLKTLSYLVTLSAS
jgi:hypothetical protein